MNYYYPLPRELDPSEERQIALAHLPLCLVQFEDSGKCALALTGGGMDMSWEICEAFMVLGFLPPVHFAGLPDMAGLKLDARNRWIMAGVEKSLRVKKRWCDHDLRGIRQLRASMKGNK